MDKIGIYLKIVTKECSIEVEVWVPLKTDVISEKESNEDARNYDISKSEHGEVGGSKSILKQILNKNKIKFTH